MLTGATFSPCGTYRYHLHRAWDATGARLVFVMLNPSTADATANDPTIRRCIRFGRALSFDGIEHRDALEVIAQQDTAGTLFYVDPPYPHATRTAVQSGSHNDTAYCHEMTDDDHRALAKVLNDVEGMVVLSGYACQLYDEDLYCDWERHTRMTLADGAQPRTEVVWLNPACSAALARSRGGLFAEVV